MKFQHSPLSFVLTRFDCSHLAGYFDTLNRKSWELTEDSARLISFRVQSDPTAYVAFISAVMETEV